MANEDTSTAVLERTKDVPADTDTVKQIVKSAGDKFRAAFEQAEKEEKQQQAAATTSAPKEDSVPDGAKAIQLKEPAPSSPPSSALEAAIGETKPEPAKEPESEFDKIETPTSENWKHARETLKNQSKRIKELESAPPPEQQNGALEAIAKERDDYKTRLEDQEKRLKAINAEYSEEYQDLQKQRDKALGKINSRMKYIGQAEKAQDLIDALNLPDSRFKTAQIKEVLSEMDPDDKSAIRVLIEGLDTVDEKISDFRKDLPAQWDRLQSERAAHMAEAEAEGMKNLDREFNKIIDELPKNVVRFRMVPEDTPGAQEWNKPIKEAISSALTAIKPGPNSADFKETVYTVAKGKMFDGLWTEHMATVKELREARARLKELDSSGPDFKGGTKPSTEVKKTPTQKFHEAMAAQAATSPE